MKNAKGLSLIEILVALIITGIIAACVSAAVIGGYYMLKQAEHKSRAMSITHVKLQEYLAKSFSELKAGIDEGDEGSISRAFNDTLDNTYFNWTVNVNEGQSAGLIPVPYKNVTVQTKYTEINTKGEPVSSKTIQLSNMVPYPLIHIMQDGKKFTGADSTLYEAPETLINYTSGMTDAQYNWGNITNAGGVLGFNYRVPKDLIVMYNLAITYDTAHPPDPASTTLTRCTLDAGTTQGIITRTPITTQVFINNILEIDNVTAGQHTIFIQWAHEFNTTKVWLRAYDVTIVAVEHTDKS